MTSRDLITKKSSQAHAFGVDWRSAQGRDSAIRLIAFTVSGILAVMLGFLYFTPAEAGELVRRFGYFGIAATFVWFAFLMVREVPTFRAWIRAMTVPEFRNLLLTVGALGVVAWVAFPPSYKVLYDELVLQATSWNLHKLREVGTMVRGYEVEGVFMPLFVYVDKRPYFYALLVSLVHDLTGFRESNAFWFNTALYPVVLGLFYAIGRRLASARVALAGMVCFGASPLLAQNANGAGMDLLNLAMILLTVLLAARYLDRPQDRTLSLLLFACVLLAQTRYESLLFVVTTGLVVLEGWRRAGRVLLPLPAILVPLLLIPSGLHNSYLSGMPSLWELREDMDSRFGLEYVWSNLGHAWSYLFNTGTGSLGAFWLSWCGVPALGALAFFGLKRWREWKRADSTLTAIGLMSIAVLANLALLMAYFWGQLDDPIVSRLIMPFTILLGVAVIVVLAKIEQGGLRLTKWVMGGALVCYFGWGLPAARQHRDINQLATELAWEQSVVARMEPRSRLILTDKTTLGWLMKGIPALILKEAENRAEQIQFHLQHGTFDEVLVTQRIRPISSEGEFEVDPRDRISDRFVLEPVHESMQGARLVRISRLVEIKPAPAVESSDQPPGSSAAAATEESSV